MPDRFCHVAERISAGDLAIGNLESALRQYAQTTQYHPYISVNAHNFWWLVTGGQGWQSDALSFAFVSYRLAGFVLFGGATLLSLAVVWRNRSALHLTAAYQSLAFFMLLTQIHENHHLPLFAPLVLACALNRRLWIVYGALSLTALANMALHDPNIVMALGYPAKEIYGGPALALPRWINALIQAALFGVLTAHVIAARRA